jgi:hypothetical protein
MVRKRADDGSYYHEPPYTKAECDEFYRRTKGRHLAPPGAEATSDSSALRFSPNTASLGTLV